nr:B3 domain-containing protein Os01g0723500-like [Ipomoea batatas]
MENLTKDQGESQSSSSRKIKQAYGSFEVHDFHISQTIGNDDKEKKFDFKIFNKDGREKMWDSDIQNPNEESDHDNPSTTPADVKSRLCSSKPRRRGWKRARIAAVDGVRDRRHYCSALRNRRMFTIDAGEWRGVALLLSLSSELVAAMKTV